MTVTGKVQKFKMREVAVAELGLEAPPRRRRRSPLPPGTAPGGGAPVLDGPSPDMSRAGLAGLCQAARWPPRAAAGRSPPSVCPDDRPERLESRPWSVAELAANGPAREVDGVHVDVEARPG